MLVRDEKIRRIAGTRHYNKRNTQTTNRRAGNNEEVTLRMAAAARTDALLCLLPGEANKGNTKDTIVSHKVSRLYPDRRSQNQSRTVAVRITYNPVPLSRKPLASLVHLRPRKPLAATAPEDQTGETKLAPPTHA